MRRLAAVFIASVTCVVAWTGTAQAQRGGTDWMTENGDAQRSAWIRADAKINKDSLSKPGFQFLWKLKVKNDDGRLEAEGEVDSNSSGQTWSWKIKDNGSVAASGSSTTGGRSGSFSVERKIPNQAGTDKVTFRASHSGEVCTGSIAF